MNKETILNYEKEFLAWCKGESILLGAPASMHEKPLVWREVRDFNDWKPLDTVYVLNDSYSTYRKALAEGKIVEVATDYNDVDGYIWKSMEDEEFHHFSIDEIRIKPEEPKFKVGDWVVNKTSKQRIVKKITSTHGDTVTVGDTEVGINVMLINDLELWQPKAGDWCWFWDSDNFPPKLRQFKRLILSNRYKYESCQGLVYLYCEPFLGQLPTTLKGL